MTECSVCGSEIWDSYSLYGKKATNKIRICSACLSTARHIGAAAKCSCGYKGTRTQVQAHAVRKHRGYANDETNKY